MTHDPRSPTGQRAALTSGKVYSLSLSRTKAVVALSSKEVLIFDLRNMSAPEQARESPLKHQLRRVALDAVSGDWFVLASSEVRPPVSSRPRPLTHPPLLLVLPILLRFLPLQGRVAVEHIDPAAKGYTFKCHRRGDLAFPVNAVASHPIYGTPSPPPSPPPLRRD